MDGACGATLAFVTTDINDATLVGAVPEARQRGYGAALTWYATLADPALPSFLLVTDFLSANRSWGFGLSIVTQRDDVSAVPGRFGWEGGRGTSWRRTRKRSWSAF
jgi:hypothetical protein